MCRTGKPARAAWGDGEQANGCAIRSSMGSTQGNGGQWVFQAAWHGSVRRGPLCIPAFRASEQSLQLFGGQLAESPAG
jgi:hypothetical protein